MKFTVEEIKNRNKEFNVLIYLRSKSEAVKTHSYGLMDNRIINWYEGESYYHIISGKKFDNTYSRIFSLIQFNEIDFGPEKITIEELQSKDKESILVHLGSTKEAAKMFSFGLINKPMTDWYKGEGFYFLDSGEKAYNKLYNNKIFTFIQFYEIDFDINTIEIKDAKNLISYKTSSKQMHTLYDMVCEPWRSDIKIMVKDYRQDVFSETINLPHSLVKAMFDAATDKQKEQLEKMFPKYNPQRFKHLQLVWCWNNTFPHNRTIRLWKKNGVYCNVIEDKEIYTIFDNYEAYKGEMLPWMYGMVKEYSK